jgi:hypothetical protein
MANPSTIRGRKRKAGYLTRNKPKPGKDKLGALIRSWPIGCWRGPIRSWFMTLGREDGTGRDRFDFKGTYAQVVERRSELMATGKYYDCIFREKEG